MPATATGRGAQVVIDPGSDTEKAIRGAYATTIEANVEKVASDIRAGLVSDGYRPDGTTLTTMATDNAVTPMAALTASAVTTSLVLVTKAGSNPTVAVWDTSGTPAGRGFWIDGSRNMAFGTVSSAGVPTGQQAAITATGGFQVQLGIGAFNATPPTVKPTVSGAKGSNAALASLLTALVSYGLITDSSSA